MPITKARPIRTPRAARYVAKQCATFARYLGRQVVESMSRWLGAGAGTRGLSGAVDPAVHEQVLRSLNPDGSSRIQRQHHAGKKQRCGTELTINHEKDTSVAAIWDRQVLSDAFESDCVALGLAESRLTTRRGAGTLIFEPIAGATMSATLHETARASKSPGEPALASIHIHTHATLAHDCERIDGSVGVVHGAYQQVGFINDASACELSARLVTRGYQVERTRHGFEIDGMDEHKGVLDLHSGRSRDIDRVVEERGWANTPAARAAAALADRPPPSKEEPGERLARWRRDAIELGFTEEKASALRSHEAPRKLTREEVDRLACAELERLDQQQVFSRNELDRAVLRAAIGTGTFAKEALEAAQRALVLCRACEIAIDRRGERYYATRARLEAETRAMECAEALRAQAFRGASEQQIQRGLKRFERRQGFQLSAEQRDAAGYLARSCTGLACVDGAAGTGKTTMLAAAKHIWQKELGLKVVGCAPSAIAARALRESMIESHTIDRLLLMLRSEDEKQAAIRTSGRFPLGVPRAYLKKALASERPPDLVVVDESSMVAPGKLEALFRKGAELGFKVVVVGDPMQLKPVKGYAGTFEGLCDKYGAATLTDIQRQRSNWGKEQVRRARHGELAQAIKAFAEMGRLRLEKSRDAAMEQLLRDWKAVGRPEDSLVLTHTRAAAAELNARLQQVRLERGELRGRGAELSAGRLYRNDIVRFTANDSTLGVINGEKARVVATLPFGAIALETQTRYVLLPRARAQELLTLAYASTTHAVQGATAELAFVLIEGPIIDESLTYVQLSRARGITRLYADKSNAGEELVLAARALRKERQGQALRFAHEVNPEREAEIRQDLKRRARGRGR